MNHYRRCQSFAKPLHGDGSPKGFAFECPCGAKSAFECPYRKNTEQPTMDKLDRGSIWK